MAQKFGNEKDIDRFVSLQCKMGQKTKIMSFYISTVLKYFQNIRLILKIDLLQCELHVFLNKI